MKRIGMLVTAICMLLMLCSCGNGRDDVIILNFWSIGGTQREPELIKTMDKFNQTVGRQNNIQVNIAYVSDSDSLLDKLLASAKEEPGANEMPDIIICSLTAMAIGEERLLDWNDYYSEEELSDYYPDFLKEGQYKGHQFVFPNRKSADVLFVNRTLFDDFARDTGTTFDDLDTWEELFTTADKYTEWARDCADPRVQNTRFFMVESIMDYLQQGAFSLGGSIWQGDLLDFSSEGFKTAFTAFAVSAINAGTSLRSEDVISAMISGEAVVGFAPSYRLHSFKDTITFFDNTKAPLELTVLPAPYFEDGTPSVILRGAGLCAIKSEDERVNQASAIFQRWFAGESVPSMTNVPVKTEEFNSYILDTKFNDTDDSSNMGRTLVKMFSEYVPVSPHYFGNYYSISSALENEIYYILEKYASMPELNATEATHSAYSELYAVMSEKGYASVP